MFIFADPPFIILSFIRLTGFFLSYSLYAAQKESRFKYLLLGWFFWGIGPLFQGNENSKSIFSLFYGLFVFMGTAFLIAGILLEFTNLHSKVISIGAFVIFSGYGIAFFLVPLEIFYLILGIYQVSVVNIAFAIGIIRIKLMREQGGKNSLFWFHLSATISIIQTTLFLSIPGFKATSYGIGFNYIIAILLELFIVSVEQYLTQKKVQTVQRELLQSQKMEAIGNLAGGIAHDFNNILTVINGLSDMMIETLSPENEDMKNNLLEIHDAGMRATMLTKQLLTFSRKEIVHPITINVNESIKGLVRLTRRLIGEDIDMDIKYSDRKMNIFCDPSHFEQIVLNLIINSRDAMPKGGKITIDLKKKVINSKPYVQITITDTGLGMSKDQLMHIFEPFYTTKKIGKGTGLGLSTVYGIVKQYKGEIEVNSTIGQGADFRIMLPISELSVQKQEKSKNYAKSDLIGHETLLIVEDEPQPRKLFQKYLKKSGYNVLVAEDPIQALSIFRTHQEPIDLLITDMIMPTMNGKELADIIIKEDPNIFVLFISGYSEKLLVEREILKRGHKYLTKPFSQKDLLINVKNLLASSREM